MRILLIRIIRAPVASCIGIVGIAITVSVLYIGLDTIRFGVIRGFETRDWVKADVTSIGLTTIHKPNRPTPPLRCEQLSTNYRYRVGETWYRGSKYHAMGQLVARKNKVYEARDRLPLLDAWYDPADPSKAVLRKGVSFDGTTESALIQIAIGSLVTLAALTYIGRKDELLRRYFPRFVRERGDPFRAGE